MSWLAFFRTLPDPFGGGSFTPARRAFDSPIAIACSVEATPCLPSRTWSISSRTNSPACVDGDFPSRSSFFARCRVDFSGMAAPRMFRRDFLLEHFTVNSQASGSNRELTVKSRKLTALRVYSAASTAKAHRTRAAHCIVRARACPDDQQTRVTVEETLNSYDPQVRYLAALHKIGPGQASRDAKRHTPIFQRDAVATQRQAVKDAATALRTLWKRSADKA